MALSRPLDKFYTIYFLLLIPIALFIDLQAIYPDHIVPQFLKNINAFYLSISADPFVSGNLGNEVQTAWCVFCSLNLGKS